MSSDNSGYDSKLANSVISQNNGNARSSYELNSNSFVSDDIVNEDDLLGSNHKAIYKKSKFSSTLIYQNQFDISGFSPDMCKWTKMSPLQLLELINAGDEKGKGESVSSPI